MNTKFDITLDETLKAIEDYPYLRECFSFHLKWLFAEGSDDRRKYDPVYMKIRNDKTETGLSNLENTFNEAGKILNLDEVRFCEAFEFNNPDKRDILKIGDLLAEPWVALALKNRGFISIKKIARPKEGEKFADFVGEFNNTKFAVEVKNARTDSDFHRWLVDNPGTIMSSYHPNGKDSLQKEREFLESVLKQKLSTPQRDKIEEQLGNTAKKYNCQKRILVLYLESSTLTLFPDQLVFQLEDARKNYSFADCLACCINGALYCSPQLS